MFGMICLLVVGAAEWVTPSLQEKIAKNPGLLQSECPHQRKINHMNHKTNMQEGGFGRCGVLC
jgi:hypothetical protein